MRAIVVSFLVACLLCFVAGCGDDTGKYKMPEHPTPAPKNLGPAVGGAPGGGTQALPVAPPPSRSGQKKP
jgi:hypothetical protein